MRPLLVLALVAGAAHADSYTAVRIDRHEFEIALRDLAVTHEEPAGLVARDNVPALGLKAGDVVHAVNGAPTSEHVAFSAELHTVVYLDVVRGKQMFVVRVTVKPDNREHTMERPSYLERIDRLRRFDALVQLTKNNAASGVEFSGMWLELGEEGDVIRSIDGAATNTVQAVLDALDRAKTHDKVVVKLERAGESFTSTIFLREAEPEVDLTSVIAKIKKVNDTTYEIPSSVLDAVLVNPMSVAKGARVVPAVKDGKPAGFKLYAIRPDSFYAKLGLQNGDTLETINGMDLSSADKALEVYAKLRDASTLTVVIHRRDQTITVTYKIISGR